MRHIELRTRVCGRSVASVYDIISDFEKYPEHTSAVRRVEITKVEGDRMVTSWEVNFRRGILRWTEEDHFDPVAYRIDFQQIAGDIDHFSGRWILHEEEGACVILFTADFDLGIPGLNDVLEPVAELALRENIHAILEGLLAQSVELLLTSKEGTCSLPPSNGEVS